MTHNMTLEKEYPTGALMFTCPTCDRRVLYRFLPESLRSIVLEDGDKNISHSTGMEAIPNLPSEKESDFWTEINDIISKHTDLNFGLDSGGSP